VVCIKLRVRLTAAWANVVVARYLVRNPGEFRRIRRWLSERAILPVSIRRPWWPYDAVDWVTTHLPPRAQVFEYGGGGSTLWLQDRGAIVTVVEHDPEWYEQLRAALPHGTAILLRPCQPVGIIASAVHEGYFDTYVAAINQEPDNSLDLVIVDGRARVDCAREAMSKVKPGGLLLLDDTERSRYELAVDRLAGWERRVFGGLKPGSPIPAQTSIWRKPPAR
jgi:hypothetical protein